MSQCANHSAYEGTCADDEEDLGRELEGHQIVVLHRSGRGLRQHRPQASGHVLVAQRHDGARHFHARFVGFGRHARRWTRIDALPRCGRSRNAGSSASKCDSAVEPVLGKPTPSSSTQTSCSSISGCRRYQSSIFSRLISGRTRERIERFLAELVELPFGLCRPHEHLEPLPPAVTAEVVQAGLRLARVATTSSIRAATVGRDAPAVMQCRAGCRGSSVPSSRWPSRRRGCSG